MPLAYDVLKKFKYQFETTAPWWEMLLLVSAVLLVLIGQFTANYIPGSEDKFVSCCEQDSYNNTVNGSESDVGASSGTKNGTDSDTFFPETLIRCRPEKIEPHAVAACVFQTSWIQQGLGTYITILGSLFGFVVLAWRLHPEANAMLSDWRSLFDELPSISPEDIENVNMAMNKPVNNRKQTPKTLLVEKLREIVRDSQLRDKHSSLYKITSYIWKAGLTLVIFLMFAYCLYILKFGFVCKTKNLEPKVFYCILKHYRSSSTNLYLCLSICVAALLIMFAAHWVLQYEKFGTPKYMITMLSKQKHVDHDLFKPRQHDTNAAGESPAGILRFLVTLISYLRFACVAVCALCCFCSWLR